VSRTAPGRLVLVVEDDDDVRQSLREMLEEEGYRVITAGDGSEGLQQLRAARPCLVLLDLLMPRMNGFELLAAVKADSTMAPVPPIVVISAGDVGSRSRALQAGAARFLPKPLNLERLLGIMSEYC
jgi:CheY-like chemotaxis protein